MRALRRLVLVVLLAVAGSGCVEAPRVGAPELDTGRHPVLDDTEYAFCHRPEEAARAWCEALDDVPADRCQGLRELCATEEETDRPAGCGGQSEPTAQPPPGPPPQGAPDAPPEPLGCTQDLDLGFASLFMQVVQWVVALFVAVVVVGLAVFVTRFLLSFARGRKGPAKPASRPIPVVAMDASEDVPDAPSDDLLLAAKSALEDGRFDEAVLLGRAAALRRLGEAGRLKLHRSRTDREYARAVRGEEVVHAQLALVVRAVEIVRWGGSAVGFDQASAVVAAAERVLRLVGVAVILWLAAGPSVARGAPLTGVDGDAAVIELFRARGWEASYRVRPVSRLAPDDAEVDVILVDADRVALGDEAWPALVAWVEAGGVLVLGAPDPVDALPDITERVYVAWPATVRVVDGAGGLPTPVLPGGPSFRFDDPRGTPVVVTDPGPGGETGDLVVAEAFAIGAGGVVAIADRRLLRNAALLVPGNEAFLVGLPAIGDALGLWALRSGKRLEIVSADAPENPSASPMQTLINARLLPFVLQLLVLVAVAAVWLGWPFARLRDPPGDERQQFSDHVRMVGHRYHRLKASRHAASAYARLWLARLGPVGLEDAAKRAGHAPESARAVVARAQELADEPDGDRSASDMTTVEELWTIISDKG